MRYHVTKKSSNKKTGQIMVTTTERKSCDPACPFMRNGCYADAGPLALHWDKVSRGERGTDLDGLCEAIESQPRFALWRHNQAGDLPGEGRKIDRKALNRIVSSNAGKCGFTYTHKTMTLKSNREAVKSANERGFTVNLSANDLADADKLSDLEIGPVCVVLPSDASENTATPQGRKVVVCPATQRDNVSCATCGLCQNYGDFTITQKVTRPIIGFPAHGTSKKKASLVASK